MVSHNYADVGIEPRGQRDNISPMTVSEQKKRSLLLTHRAEGPAGSKPALTKRKTRKDVSCGLSPLLNFIVSPRHLPQFPRFNPFKGDGAEARTILRRLRQEE